MKPRSSSLLLRAVLILFSFASLPAAASATPATGVIEGRVFSPAGGEYLAQARVTVEGAALEVFTDADGRFRVSGVPAGTARLRVAHSGFLAANEVVTVVAGEVARRDVSLALAAAGGERSVVKLDEFVIATSREMSGAAIAINEQRHAPNLRSVVATDELGFVPEGNVGEFIKFLPGVSMDNIGGFARNVSINGVPPDFVPVTIDGFSVASANPGGGTGRSVSLDMLSINNLARVEVVFSPTPDNPGSALAGAVNMIPRGAFERARPVLNWNAYLLMRDNAREFHRTPGPQRADTRKVHPGFDFTYIRPVNARFGFTLSAGTSTNYLNQDFMQNTWRGTGAATNGTTFPHTTPDRPYLSSYLLRDNTKQSTRNSFSSTLDFRPTPRDRVTLGLQFSSTAFANMSRNLTFNVNATDPGAFTPFATRGRAGAGSLTLANTGQTRDNRTLMPTMVWRHRGAIWQAEAGLGYSRASHTLRNMDRGLFNNVTTQRTGVTVAFDDIFYLRPRLITVTDGANGAPVDPYRLDNYVLVSTTGSEQHNSDTQHTAYANIRRDFAWRIPVALKAGLDRRQSTRDLRGTNAGYTFVGRDGRASTTTGANDDNAGPFVDARASLRVAPYGFPRVQWASSEAVLDLYRANPGYFTPNANSEYRSEVSASKRSQETVSAAYLRADAAFLDRRLRLTGGVRAEQTNVEAEGPLTDPTRNFQRDARGNPVLGAGGRPLLVATDALAVSRLTFLERASRSEKEYLRWFPSLNASLNLRENLVARAAVYQSIGRPNLNQYAGGITLPDTESAPSSSNRITVNNAGLKAWTARTLNARVEYYFDGVGQVSAGVFRRNYENFASSAIIRPGVDFFDLYGIDAATYGAYEVATQQNIEGIVRTTGFDVAYKQSLTFLPAWARGLHAFANASFQRATGAAAQNFAGYVPRTFNWGLSLTRAKYNVRVNWNYRGRQRGNVVSGTGIEAGTYNWGNKKLSADVQAEYHLRKSVTVFANLRNVNNGTEDNEIAGPSTPSHAQFRQREDFGSLWTVGVKGAF